MGSSTAMEVVRKSQGRFGTNVHIRVQVKLLIREIYEA